MRQAHFELDHQLAHNAAELDQADDRRSNHRVQTGCEPILITQDAEGFEAPNPVLDVHALRGELLVLVALLISQRAALWLLMRGRHLRVCAALISLIAQAHLTDEWRRQRNFFVKLEVSLRAAMPGINLQDFSVLIGDDLRLDRVAFLLTRVDAFLSLIDTGAAHGRLETINNHEVNIIGRPLRRTALPLLFRCPLG